MIKLTISVDSDGIDIDYLVPDNQTTFRAYKRPIPLAGGIHHTYLLRSHLARQGADTFCDYTAQHVARGDVLTNLQWSFPARNAVASSAQRQVLFPYSADDFTWLDEIGGGLLSGPHVSVVMSGANCLPHDVRQNRQSRQSMNQSLLVGQRSGLVNMHGGNVREDNY